MPSPTGPPTGAHLGINDQQTQESMGNGKNLFILISTHISNVVTSCDIFFGVWLWLQLQNLGVYKMLVIVV